MKRFIFILAIILLSAMALKAQNIRAIRIDAVHYEDSPPDHYYAAVVYNYSTEAQEVHLVYDFDPGGGGCPCAWNVVLPIPQIDDIVGLKVSAEHRRDHNRYEYPTVILSFADGKVFGAIGDYTDQPSCICIPPSGWQLLYDFGYTPVATDQSTWGSIKDQFK